METLRSIFRYIKETFFGQTFSYLVNLPFDSVLQKFDYLFTERKGIFSAPNLTGDFIGFPNGFYLAQKWSFVNTGGGGDNATLTGSLNRISDHQTQIDVKVKPHFGLLGGFIMCILTAIIQLIFLVKDPPKTITEFIIPITILTTSAIIVAVARNVCNSLRRLFEDFIDVRQ